MLKEEQTLDLQALYREDEDARLPIRSPLALAFVHVEQIHPGYDLLRHEQEFEDTLEELA